MEAKSVEDKGEGICFCVFCYNVQPGVVIDYADGTSREDGSAVFLESTKKPSETPAVKTSAGETDAPASTTETPASQSPLESTQTQTAQPAEAQTEAAAVQSPTETSQPQTSQQTAPPIEEATSQPPAETPVSTGYVLNMNTHKFHRPDCSSVGTMKSKNRQDVNWTKAECEAAGYEGCKNCNP